MHRAGLMRDVVDVNEELLAGMQKWGKVGDIMSRDVNNVIIYVKCQKKFIKK